MKLSVICNTKNEGRRVVATCEQFLKAGADEVIICADGTTDGSCDNLPSGVVVIRNKESQGCGKAKFHATLKASGDVLMWVDAHQSVESGDIRKMAMEALNGGLIITPALANIFYDESWQPCRVVGSDRLFIPNNASLLPNCSAQYSFKEGRQTFAIGVGLCMSRATYLRVGGWNRYHGRHGSQERGMALRAYMADVPVKVDHSVVLGHEFYGENHPSRNSKTGQYRFNNLAPASHNAWHAFMAICSPSFFEAKIKPWLLACDGLASGEKVMTDATALQDRDYFLRHCKRRPDGDLMKLITSLVAHHSPQPDPKTHSLEPMAVSYLKALAHGRCLECGTGSTGGTAAILQGAMQVTSIDHLEKYTIKAREKIKDERVQFDHRPIDPSTGFYDLTGINGKFDFILIDGPPGTVARRQGIPALLPFLAEGGTILVDDAKRDIANIESAQREYHLHVENLPTKRGLVKITRPSANQLDSAKSDPMP